MKVLGANSHQRGTALIIVMALLIVMCVLMLCAARSVTFVKSELKLIEKRQVERCAQGTAGVTRPVP